MTPYRSDDAAFTIIVALVGEETGIYSIQWITRILYLYERNMLTSPNLRCAISSIHLSSFEYHYLADASLAFHCQRASSAFPDSDISFWNQVDAKPTMRLAS